MLSRNKSINYLHTVTGWSYKKCRTKLKANNWSLYYILYPRECLFRNAFNDLNESVAQFVKVVKEAFGNIDYWRLINEIAKVYEVKE